jgi:hypothetical protein
VGRRGRMGSEVGDEVGDDETGRYSDDQGDLRP